MREDWRTSDYTTLPDDEAVEVISKKLGVGPVAARFVLALERGERGGDAIVEGETNQPNEEE